MEEKKTEWMVNAIGDRISQAKNFFPILQSAAFSFVSIFEKLN